MNKIVKSIASVTLAFGTVLGVSTTVLPIEDTAHAATKPYYVYNGYVDKDAKFVTNKQFIKAVKYGNVTMNGIKFEKAHSNKALEKYNQKFTGVSKDGKKANKVQFSVKGDLTYNQLKKAYGSDFKKVKGTPSDKKSGIFEYQPKKDGLIVSFVITHGRTVEVDIGYEGVTTSK